MQINPDDYKRYNMGSIWNMFQSYQFMQINPDSAEVNYTKLMQNVSIVSIHADQSRPEGLTKVNVYIDASFQSYQFMQINPDNS